MCLAARRNGASVAFPLELLHHISSFAPSHTFCCVCPGPVASTSSTPPSSPEDLRRLRARQPLSLKLDIPGLRPYELRAVLQDVCQWEELQRLSLCVHASEPFGGSGVDRVSVLRGLPKLVELRVELGGHDVGPKGARQLSQLFAASIPCVAPRLC